jgi:hypothetical protein
MLPQKSENKKNLEENVPICMKTQSDSESIVSVDV